MTEAAACMMMLVYNIDLYTQSWPAHSSPCICPVNRICSLGQVLTLCIYHTTVNVQGLLSLIVAEEKSYGLLGLCL